MNRRDGYLCACGYRKVDVDEAVACEKDCVVDEDTRVLRRASNESLEDLERAAEDLRTIDPIAVTKNCPGCLGARCIVRWGFTRACTYCGGAGRIRL